MRQKRTFGGCSSFFKIPPALALVFVFAGSLAGAVELTYWPSSNPEEIKLAEIMTAEWNKLHPGITVRMQPLPATQSSEEALLSAIVSKTTPDVCSNILPAIMGRFVKSGAVVALDRFKDYKEVIYKRTGLRLARTFHSRDGRLYQVPWKCNPVMLVYNAEIFKSLGLKPPRTYGEFADVAKTLTRDLNGDGRPDRWAMKVSIKNIWWQRLFDFYTFYVAAGGGKTLLQNDKAAFNNDNAVKVMKFFREGFKNNFFPVTGFAGDAFLDGKVAMDVAGPWAVKYYQRIKPGFRFAFSRIPTPDRHEGPVYTYGDPKNIVIFSNTKYPGPAWEFVKFLISKEADRRLLEITNQMPMRQGLAGDAYFADFFRKNPLLKKPAEQAAYVSPSDESVHLVQILDFISGQFEASAVYGVISPEKSIEAAAAQVQNIYDYW